MEKFSALRERIIALSTDKQAKVWQIAVLSNDNSCLQFVWREYPDKKVEVEENTQNVCWEKIWQLVQFFAFNQVAKHMANNYEPLIKTSSAKLLHGRNQELSRSNWNILEIQRQSCQRWFRNQKMGYRWLKDQATDRRSGLFNQAQRCLQKAQNYSLIGALCWEDKDHDNKPTSFRKHVEKFEAYQFHVCIGRSNVRQTIFQDKETLKKTHVIKIFPVAPIRQVKTPKL